MLVRELAVPSELELKLGQLQPESRPVGGRYLGTVQFRDQRWGDDPCGGLSQQCLSEVVIVGARVDLESHSRLFARTWFG